MAWYLPGIYLAVGMAALLLIDAKQVKDVVGEAIGLLIGWALWPLVLLGRLKWRLARKAYNRAAAVRRQDHLSANYLKYDPDAWWAGKDLAPDAIAIWRPRHAR